MSQQTGQTKSYSDPIITQIGRLMANYGSNQMLNHLQREMSRYSGTMKQQNVDENGNVEMTHNNNGYVASASRKRVRGEPICDVDHQKKIQKSDKK